MSGTFGIGECMGSDPCQHYCVSGGKLMLLNAEQIVMEYSTFLSTEQLEHFQGVITYDTFEEFENKSDFDFYTGSICMESKPCQHDCIFDGKRERLNGVEIATKYWHRLSEKDKEHFKEYIATSRFDNVRICKK